MILKIQSRFINSFDMNSKILMMRLLFMLFGFFASPSVSILSAQTPNPDADWVDLLTVAPDVVLDIRYATTNNFMSEKVYDCGECYLRKEVADAISRVHKRLKAQGDRKSTRLNSSHSTLSRMPSSA